MKYLITGGTGFIGSALCRHLLARGAELIVVSRHPSSVLPNLAPSPDQASRIRGIGSVAAWEEPVDVVINLAGAPIAGGRWSARRRRILRDSRLEATAQLIGYIQRCDPRPRVFLSASAVGYYGDRGDQVLTESASAGEGFLADLCRAWESAALAAEAWGVRTCRVRLGLVLGPDGGLLATLASLYRWGLGGRLGSGRQWMPWIHRDDLLALIDHLVEHPIQGPVNATAPNPVRQGDFSRALGAAVRRPALWWIPSVILRMALGEMAATVLASQRARPERAEQTGFAFRFQEIGPSLAHLLAPPDADPAASKE
jgi:uncharacterized protein